MANNCVIVWCQRARRGLLSVFDPKVSNEIEHQHVLYQRSSTNTSGRRTSKARHKLNAYWKGYEIDFQVPHLRNDTTGHSIPIFRQVCSPDSVFSQGHRWVVEADGRNQWMTFDFETSDVIERAFAMAGATASAASANQLDLTKNSSGRLPYIIDLKSLTQTNVHTKRLRTIRREALAESYTPQAMATSSSANSATLASSLTNGGKPPKISKSSSSIKKRLKRSKSLNSSSTSVPVAQQSYSTLPRQLHSSSSSSASASASSCPWMPSREEVTESLPVENRVEITREAQMRVTNDVSCIEKYLERVPSDTDGDCIICLSELREESGFGEEEDQARDVVKLVTCQHAFHRLCLQAMYRNVQKDGWLECPSCKMIYGEKLGDCPPGEMQWKLEAMTIPGYEGYQAISLLYFIPPGIQGPGHPNPGQSFRSSGFPREGFLPDCNKGRKVLKLLMEAFRRRLMFTIGTSLTTGRANTVTWNEIHLKTEPTSNHHGHGYPDPCYLDNVLQELASHGIRDDGIYEEEEEAFGCQATRL